MKNAAVKYNKCLNDLYTLFRDFKETLNKEQSEYAFALFNMYLVKSMSDSAVVGDGEVLALVAFGAPAVLEVVRVAGTHSHHLVAHVSISVTVA